MFTMPYLTLHRPLLYAAVYKGTIGFYPAPVPLGHVGCSFSAGKRLGTSIALGTGTGTVHAEERGTPENSPQTTCVTKESVPTSV